MDISECEVTCFFIDLKYVQEFGPI